MRFYFMVAIASVLVLAGCGESGGGTTVVEVQGAETIPIDKNTTIIDTNNVSSITYGDNAIIVSCEGGSDCDITLGDKSSTTDNSTTTTNTDNNGTN